MIVTDGHSLIRIDGVLVDPMGQPWEAPKPYPGAKLGGIASQARAKTIQKLDPEEARRGTRKSQIYWLIVRIAQEAKRETMGYDPPGWLGAKKREPRRRQWLPGEHKKPPKSTTAKEQNLPPAAVDGNPSTSSGQGNLF